MKSIVIHPEGQTSNILSSLEGHLDAMRAGKYLFEGSPFKEVMLSDLGDQDMMPRTD